MKKVAAVLAIAVCLSLTACGRDDTIAQPEIDPAAQVQAQRIVADPQGAVEEIYKDISIQEVSPLDEDILSETLGFDINTIAGFYGRYSSGRYGLADVYILKAYDEDYEIVREQLEAVKLDRMKKTESYDILDSHKIAQNAQIFQYGSYLVMLMLEDNEAAQDIIEQYIPSSDT